MTYLPFDAAKHRKQEYIWLRVGDLNNFQDIWTLSVRRGLGTPPGPMILSYHLMSPDTEETRIYLVKGLGS